MKILFFSFFPLEYGGGFEKYIIQTANELTKRFKSKITILTANEQLSEKILLPLSLYNAKRISKKDIYRNSSEEVRAALDPRVNYLKCSSLKEIRRELVRASKIYSKNELLEASLLKFFSYRKLPPVIFGCATATYYPISNSIQAKLHNYLYGSFVYKWLASGVKQFHVKNSFDEIYIKKLFPQKPVQKIYNAFDPKFIQSSQKLKSPLRIDPKKINIIWTGRLTEQKGITELIEIINSVNRSPLIGKIQWNIVGDGEDREKIEILRERWPNVGLFGHMKPSLVASMLRQSQLFISTSKAETFGNNILEAQSLGVPVVAFDISGPSDIIENQKTGLLINGVGEFIEAIISILEGKFVFSDIENIAKSKFSPDKIYISFNNMIRGKNVE